MQALGYCTLNSEYTVADVLEVTPHTHLHGGKNLWPLPLINRTKAKAESLSPLSPFLLAFSSSFMSSHLTPSTPSTPSTSSHGFAFRTRRGDLIIDADRFVLKPVGKSSPGLKELRLLSKRAHRVARVSKQPAENNPSSASSNRGVSVPGLLQTRLGRCSQAGTGAKLLSAIMRGQRRQINAQVLIVHLFSLLQGNGGRRSAEGGAAC